MDEDDVSSRGLPEALQPVEQRLSPPPNGWPTERALFERQRVGNGSNQILRLRERLLARQSSEKVGG